MQQHPVPQHIAGYEFRLVGDMTLKQFLELAGGAAAAAIVYGSGLPVFLKWPLIIFFGLAGAAFAFLPFQERPLDVWLKNFFKSVYSPTLYLWQKQETLPDFFLYQRPAEKPSNRIFSSTERAQFAEYLKTLPKNAPMNSLDKKEAQALSIINQFLQSATGIQPSNLSSHFYPKIPSPVSKIKIQPLASDIKKPVKPQFFDQEMLSQKNQKTTQDAKPKPIIRFAEPLNAPIEIGTPYKPFPVPAKRTFRPVVTRKVIPPPAEPASLPIPNPPEIPNVIVGMVLNSQGKILPGAIIEIRDAEGMPVRASKTNKLGQFFIVTPLQDGDYEIETEYPEEIFDIIKLKTEGKIIPPLKIQAKTI
jgi:hypothetical protein